jgi:hypothetical protein
MGGRAVGKARGGRSGVAQQVSGSWGCNIPEHRPWEESAGDCSVCRANWGEVESREGARSKSGSVSSRWAGGIRCCFRAVGGDADWARLAGNGGWRTHSRAGAAGRGASQRAQLQEQRQQFGGGGGGSTHAPAAASSRRNEAMASSSSRPAPDTAPIRDGARGGDAETAAQKGSSQLKSRRRAAQVTTRGQQDAGPCPKHAAAGTRATGAWRPTSEPSSVLCVYTVYRAEQSSAAQSSVYTVQ